jgi:hypothetical protein
MIFMSQSAITDPNRAVDWGNWYEQHLHIMATVPGVFSAQRFLTASTHYPPSLALYGVANAQVFEGEYYLSVRGMGEWLPLIDRRWYRRNLFSGLQTAPEVGENQVLLICDQTKPQEGFGGVQWEWLPVAGIDCSTPYRGLAVLGLEQVRQLPETVAVYTVASKRYINANPEGNP